MQALRKSGGEGLWHVLHDNDAGAHAGQARQDMFQRLRAARRGAYRHDALGGLRQAGQRLRQARWLQRSSR